MESTLPKSPNRKKLKEAWITYLCIAGFWLFYPIAMILMAMERFWDIPIQVNRVMVLLLLFGGIPIGTYGIYRTDWDLPSKIVVWIVCILAIVGCLLPFGLLVIYCFGMQAT